LRKGDNTDKINAVNKAKLLKKYGGLSWLDEDNNQAILTLDKENMQSKTAGDYCVRACNSGYRDDDISKKSHVEPWEILVDLIHCIKVYNKTHRNKGVQVVGQEEEGVNNANNNKLNHKNQSQKKKTPSKTPAKQTHKNTLEETNSDTDVD
jgi:hypothetical protein